MILQFPVCGDEPRTEDTVRGNGPRLYAEAYPEHVRRGGSAQAGAVDIFAAEGAHVHSPTGGRVLHNAFSANGGHTLTIVDDQGERHYLAHMRDVAKPDVGERVVPGQLVGFVGRTGNAAHTGPHLHYQVQDKDGHAYDPTAALLRIVLGHDVTYFHGDIREDWNGPVPCPSRGEPSPLASLSPPADTEPNATLRVTDADGRGVGILILGAAVLSLFGGDK